MTRQRASFFSMHCPHCGARSIVRNSVELSDQVREITFACAGDPICGHTFKAMLSITATLSPSGCPRPGVDIPMSPHSHAAILREQAEAASNQPDMFGIPQRGTHA